MKKNKVILYITFLLTTLGLIALDQYSKVLAIDHLKDKEPIVIIKGIFELLYVENKGAAYGMLAGKISFFLVITFILVPVIIYSIFKISSIIEYFGEKVNTKAFKILQLDMIIILAGAIGNCIDRVTKGYVVDYFYFKLIDFPVFNVADCYITVAVAVMLIMCFFVLKDKELDYFMGSKKKWQVEDESK